MVSRPYKCQDADVNHLTTKVFLSGYLSFFDGTEISFSVLESAQTGHLAGVASSQRKLTTESTKPNSRLVQALLRSPGELVKPNGNKRSSISELCTRVQKLVPRSVGIDTWYLMVVRSFFESRVLHLASTDLVLLLLSFIKVSCRPFQQYFLVRPAD